MEIKRHKWRAVFLVVFLVLIIIVVMVYLFLMEGKNKETDPQAQEPVADHSDRGIPQDTFSPFYYAEDGKWVLQQSVTHVLREQKYVSSKSELDQYTVARVPAGGIIRILEADGRWKRVEVLKGEQAIAVGWIDAHPIREVRKVPDREIPE